MKMIRRAVLGIVVGVLSVGGAAAQIKNQQPAEFPPSTYKGKQYVDSKGCVFIRAGIDGDVAWVPRVTRDRKTVCGFAPSLSAAARVAQPAPAPQQVEQITLETPAPAPAQPVDVVAATPTPAPSPTPKPATAAEPVVEVAAQPRPVAAPRRAVVRQVARPAKPVRRAAAPLRAAPSRVVVVTDPDSPIEVSPHRRIVPRHVAQNRVNTTNVKIPHGYKAAWDDDRLNPKRAEQTLAGRGQMLLIWTNTVPRRLIDRRSGKDVTASTPLVYPYVDPVTQSRELGEVKIVRRNGGLFKRILRKRQPVISTRSAPKAKVAAPAATPAKKRAVANKRYVQIGFFTTKAKANKAAQHLAGLGMRARIGKVRKGGKSYLSVAAGPFNTPNATQRAVSRLHGFGYTGAVARN